MLSPYNCSSAEIEHDLSITAREGDLNAVGSQLKAGNDVALSASRDITLQSAQNTQLLEG
ncbi:hemagglutinin repeat-containing protein, partial [Raoultella planticola]|uniref:hemagglutinin repeat-containing protein n=1 Tax=Raoultella planticola TaxID=575 RepID=UPI0032EE5C55